MPRAEDWEVAAESPLSADFDEALESMEQPTLASQIQRPWLGARFDENRDSYVLPNGMEFSRELVEVNTAPGGTTNAALRRLVRRMERIQEEPPPAEPRAYRNFAIYCKQCGEYLGLYALGDARIDIAPCKNCTEQKRDEGYTAGYDDGFAYGEDAREKHTG